MASSSRTSYDKELIESEIADTLDSVTPLFDELEIKEFIDQQNKSDPESRRVEYDPDQDQDQDTEKEEENNLTKDPPYEQKFTLLQFASKNECYKEGETLGIKICGTYKTLEEVEKHAKKLEDGYFSLEVQNVGEWIAFPDKKNPNKTTLNPEKTIMKPSMFGKEITTPEFLESNKGQSEEVENYHEEQKKIMFKTTYFGEPEKQDDLDELICNIKEKIFDISSEYTVFKNLINKNIKEIKKREENAELENENKEKLKINPEEDFYLNHLKIESEQKFALISYVDTVSTSQKGKTFCFKVRGCFDSQKKFNKYKKYIHNIDKKFDLFQVPVGVWIPFNSNGDYEKASNDLNTILGETIVQSSNEEKEFKLRRKNAKENKTIDEVEWTLDELKNSVKNNFEKLKKFTNEFVDYCKMYKYNIDLYKKLYDSVPDKLYDDFEKLKTQTDSNLLKRIENI